MPTPNECRQLEKSARGHSNAGIRFLSGATLMDTMDELRELHARLVRAQRAENEAIRKLGAFTATGNSDKSAFKALFDAAHAAGRHAVAIYDEWNLRMQGLQGIGTNVGYKSDASARKADSGRRSEESPS
jgi:hypothetical protein